MRNKHVISGLIWLAVCSFHFEADGRDVPVFSDDFDTPGLFIENWDASKGLKPENGAVRLSKSESIKLRRKVEGNISVSFEMAVNRIEGESGGFCGMELDGIKFLVPQNGRAWVVYRLPGEKRSKGFTLPIEEFEFGKKLNIEVSRQILSRAAKYVYKVNGKTMFSFIESGMKQTGRISFQAWRMNCVIDNFRLYRSQNQEASPNLAVNSSFEYLQQGMPIYFNPTRSYTYSAPLEEYFKTWRIDRKNKRSGKQSLRLELDPSVGTFNSVTTFNTGITPNQPIMYSLYLKASKPDFPVTLRIWEMRTKWHQKKIELSTKWQRYEFLLEAPERSTVRCGLSFTEPGVVWVDDIQIEIGKTATSYQASSLDADKFRERKEVASDTHEKTGKKDHQKPRLPFQEENTAPLELFTRYNYYMNEAHAVLIGRLNRPGLASLKGVLTVGNLEQEVALSNEFSVQIPLKQIPYGRHRVVFDIFDGPTKVLQGETTLVKKPFFKGATQIDHQRRCLIVDGKPTLIIAPLVEIHSGMNDKPELIERIVKFYSKHGFKTLMLVGNNDRLPAIKYFLRYANEAGIKTLNWPSTWRTRDTIGPEQVVKAWKSDSTLAWLAIDEPELYAKSDEVEHFLTHFRKQTPYHPTFMNNTVGGIPARFAGLNTDILMLDDYLTNREGRKVKDIIKQADIMWNAGKKGRKPCFYFLVGNNMHNHYREPTYGEQIAQSYGSVIANCSGLAYFLGRPSYPENWRALKQLNAELLSLQEVIFSLEKVPSVSFSNRAVRFMTRKLNNKMYILAVNLTNRRIDENVSLPRSFTYQPQVKVEFEQRTISIKNNQFSDTFQPHQRHVYVLDIKR